MTKSKLIASCLQCPFTTESVAMFSFHMQSEHGVKPHLVTKNMERDMPEVLEALRLEGVEKKSRIKKAQASRRPKSKR